MMESDNIVNPAEEIKNRMKEFGISQQQLAHLLGIPVETLKRKLLRNRTMDIEFIYNIQRVLGIKDNHLIEEEYKYREFEEKEEDFLDEYNKIKKIYDVLESKKLVEKTSNIKETVKNFRKFMEVSNYSKVQKEFHIPKSFNLTYEDKLFLLVWIQIGLKKIRKHSIKIQYNIDKSKEQYIDEINNIMEKDFNKKLTTISEKYGIILNFEESLKDLPVKAYSKKLPSGKIFVQMICNLKNEDVIKTLEKIVNESYDENEHFYRVYNTF